MQQKGRLDAIKKAPNSTSCKMATVLKKNPENKFCLIFFVFILSVEVFGIGFQGHFLYISRSRFSTSSTEGSIHIWFCCVSM